MSLAARSPRSRKSLSAFDTNINANYTLPVTNKGKKRVVASMDGETLKSMDAASIRAGAFNMKSNPRRNVQPRKSILKSFSAPHIARQTEDETLDYSASHQYAHTVAFGPLSNVDSDPTSRNSRQSLGGRRVSFAPNAHVRMFERQVTKNPRASFGFSFTETSTPSVKSNHSRRSSILDIGSVSKPNIFAPSIFQGEGEAEGEESMEIEDDKELSGFDTSERDETQQEYSHDGSAEGEDLMEMEEEDMDITQQIYGGIVRRSSIAPTVAAPSELDAGAYTEDESDNDQGHSHLEDEEKTMDFTIAVGGLLPHEAPATATRNRNSIGYSFPNPDGPALPNLMPGQAEDHEIEYPMEETEVYGAIVGQDVSFSSGSEDTMGSRSDDKTMTFTYSHQIAFPAQTDGDEGMDMITSAGGIISLPPVSPGLSVRNNARPISGTPSFARPTVSSAQKSTTTKRNVFAPSPSPVKSTTPRKSGIQTAAEVAKRLSFGSVTSSGGKKRVREDIQETEGSMKKTRIEAAAEEVFGTPHHILPFTKSEEVEPPALVVQSTTPPSDPPHATVISARRSSLGTEMRLSLPPQRPVAPPQQETEERNEDNITELQRHIHEQPQDISLAAFLEIAGVQFMEGLSGLNRKRSNVAKEILGQSYANERDFALHEYTEAQVNSIFLNMYTWASNKLFQDIQTGDEELAAVSARCDIDSPPVIQEYLAASDEDKQLFEMTFKSFKTNTHLKAKEMWYDWMWQLLETIKPDVQTVLTGMKEDKKRLTAFEEQAVILLPQLRARKTEVESKLAEERKAVIEFESCDQAELAAYKEAIAEQSAQITNFSTEVADLKNELATLTGKLEELNAKKHEYETAIAHAKGQCDQFTRSDAIRLQEESISLQHFHLWRPTKILPERMELIYDAEILLSINCTNYVPDISSATLEYLSERMKLSKRKCSGIRGESPSRCLFEVFRGAVGDMIKHKSWDLASFVQQTGILWSNAQRIRAELRYIEFHHPLFITYNSSTFLMSVSANIMIPQAKSKVLVWFDVDKSVVRGFPGSLGGVGVSVKSVYGQADANLLEQTARQTIEMSRPEACLGTFLQVCVEVGARYSS
ncbi:kinetochore protein Spc7/SPC105 [Cryptococcus neoformans A2-102-5]|nr:kinetochore protein Spc7/SPC105 [Cryptococcus neoformans var. grubii D17-1]OXG92380.1 kinetochore protein Spc7/SPC105 [Cryptococcus neoformans var. grubii A2-102-5]